MTAKAKLRNVHPVIRRMVAEAKRRGWGWYHGQTFAVFSCGKRRRIEVLVDRKPEPVARIVKELDDGR